jgi:hypothetical protein
MRAILIGLTALGALAAFADGAAAATCANGVYRAGCVGPNGAVVAPKNTVGTPGTVHCASGAYHAGCAGPNGAVVTGAPGAAPVRRGPGGCYWRNGVRVCP